MKHGQGKLNWIYVCSALLPMNQIVNRTNSFLEWTERTNEMLLQQFPFYCENIFSDVILVFCLCGNIVTFLWKPLDIHSHIEAWGLRENKQIFSALQTFYKIIYNAMHFVKKISAKRISSKHNSHKTHATSHLDGSRLTIYSNIFDNSEKAICLDNSSDSITRDAEHAWVILFHYMQGMATWQYIHYGKTSLEA